MLVGFDANEANVSKRVGVHNYTFELIWALSKLINNQDIHRLLLFLKNKPLKDFPKSTKRFEYKLIPDKKLWLFTRLSPYLLANKNKFDVFFSPNHYLPLLNGIKSVCTIHDLGYLNSMGQFKKRDYWQLKYWTAYSLYISKYIIAISDTTKEDIVRHYSKYANKIHVVRHGYDDNKFNDNINVNNVRHVIRKYNINSDYILSLGLIKPSKNIEGIIKSFELISKEYPNIKLVIAGKKGWMFNGIFEQVKSLNIGGRVIFTDYIPEPDKPALIKGAKMLISPSFWEGFGMHVIEALACGTPVVVSNISALKEVAGDAGIYIDPHDVNSIKNGIIKILNLNEKDYNKIVQMGINKVKGNSWDKTASTTLEVLTSK